MPLVGLWQEWHNQSMTPTATHQLHLALEWVTLGTALGALGLLRRQRARSQAARAPAVTSPDFEEQAKTQEALLREVNHRVKNNFCALIGLLQVKREYARTPQETSHLKDMEASLAGLAATHNMLALSGWGPLRADELCRVLVSSATNLSLSPCRCTVVSNPDTLTISPTQAHPLTLIVNELASNAIKHAVSLDTALALSVTIHAESGHINLRFTDNGPGYPADVLDHSRANGSGLQIMRDLARGSLQGSLRVANNGGAETILSFPVTP